MGTVRPDTTVVCDDAAHPPGLRVLHPAASTDSVPLRFPRAAVDVGVVWVACRLVRDPALRAPSGFHTEVDFQRGYSEFRCEHCGSAVSERDGPVLGRGGRLAVG